MGLPYERACTGDRALAEIEKLLRGFGCNKVGNWMDYDVMTLTIQFEYRGQPVQVKASAKGYAAAYLREHPYDHARMRKSKSQHDKAALDQGMVAMYSILRDWIKGQIMAVETGILTFEGAFLGQLLLPSGLTVLEHAQQQKLLPLKESA